jgi:hypothetical protein
VTAALPPSADRAWAAPESSPGGGVAAAPTVGRPGPGGDVRGAGAAGVAVARGDARPEVAATGPGGASPALDGNPFDRLMVTGPGGVLDGGFDLLRFRFRRLVGITAVIFVPIQLLELVLALTVGTAAVTSDGSSTGALSGLGLQSAGSSGWAMLFLVVKALATCVLGIAVGHLVAGWLEDRDPTFRDAVLFAVTRSWVAPVVVVVAAGSKLVLACLGGVGWFLADALFFIAGIVAGAERTGPFATVGRSVRLTRSAYGLSLVVCVGSFVICQILQFALTVGPILLLASFQPPEGWLVAAQQLASLVLLVALPLTACIAARAYVELRCRAEGYDLVRRQVDHGLA